MLFKSPTKLYAIALLVCFLTVCPQITSQTAAQVAEPKPVAQAPGKGERQHPLLRAGSSLFPRRSPGRRDKREESRAFRKM